MNNNANKTDKLRDEQIRSFFDLSGGILVALNSKGNIILLNPKGAEILGYSVDEVIGKNWFDTFIPKSLCKNVKTVFKKLIAGDVEPVSQFTNERFLSCVRSEEGFDPGNYSVTVLLGKQSLVQIEFTVVE